MLKDANILASRIIEFYGDRGIDCSVVDEHRAFLVTLCADGKVHAFRYGSRAIRSWHRISRLLEWESSKLKGTASSQPAGRRDRRQARPAAEEPTET